MDKILLFSSDSVITSSIMTCLLQAGYHAIHLASGIGAFDLIRSEQPAAIILDIELNDFNSLALIRSLRSNGATSRTPIILVGSNLREEDVLLGLEVGADLCLRETFHPDVFIARLRSLVRRYNGIPATNK